jgi:DNA invertase Pin-like site-specific DNA recombinase
MLLPRGRSTGLGRSLQDLVGFLGELNAAGCDLYLEKQAVDTTTPAGRALFQLLGVFAEFERAIIQERIHAGLIRAREKGTKSGRPIGRARISPAKEAAIRSALASGTGIRRTARECGTGTSAVQRIKAEGTRRDGRIRRR